MSWLIRLYPPSWRKRYGRELDALVQDTPQKVGVALDLLIGAAIAYRDVIGANRVLSAAGAYLHGLCVAVLLQAIVFVTLVLVGQRSAAGMDFSVGPIDLVTFQASTWHGNLLRQLGADVWVQRVAIPIATEVAVLLALGVALALVMAAPRMLRSLK